jgi:hypothetical protein
MNNLTTSEKKPFDSLEIRQAIVRFIRRKRGVQVGVEDIGARPTVSSTAESMYVIITQKTGIEDVVAEAVSTVSKHARTATGVWVLSEREVAQLLQNERDLAG